jgi:hypothetical protein
MTLAARKWALRLQNTSTSKIRLMIGMDDSSAPSPSLHSLSATSSPAAAREAPAAGLSDGKAQKVSYDSHVPQEPAMLLCLGTRPA